MNKKDIDNSILTNRGNLEFLDSIIHTMKAYKTKLDWQMDKFLATYCTDIGGLDTLNSMDTANPLVRYYKHKCAEYSWVERTIRVAGAYK
jgi:hypothetical protein